MSAPPAAEAHPGAIRWLLGGQLLMFVGIAAVFPVAPLYVREHGGGAVAAALFIAGPLLANTITQYPAGWLVDHVGRRPILLGSRVAYGLLALVLFADRGPLWVLGLLRTGQGVCSGAYVPALLAAVSDLTPAGRRAERFSQLQAAELVGLLVGPMIGGVAALWRSSAIFLVTGLAVLAGVVVQARIPVTRGRRHRAGAALAPGWWRARGVAVPAIALAAIGAAFAMYDVVWPQYLQTRGAGTVLIGLSISLFAVPMLILATPGGRLSDRSDRRVVLGVCFAGVAATCATYPLLHSVPVIIAVGIVEAVGFVMCEPSLYATLGDCAPAQGRGRVLGLGSAAQMGGSAVGSALLGSAYGLREGVPFWGASAGLLGAAVLCALAIPPRGRSAADGTEAGLLVVDGLDDGDDALGPDVDGPAVAGELDEVGGVAADADRRDGVGDLELDEDVVAVAETE